MRRSNRELWAALLATLLIGTIYILVVRKSNSIPAASGWFGHGIGILGFVLMLATETLYSLRKRSRKARWGRPSRWLSFHIFTGIVGPFMVLLHTSWKFNGLAGIVTLLTIIIVVSGFIGRYIYTAIPRSIEGLVIETGASLERQSASLASTRRLLALWHSIHIPIGIVLFTAAFVHIIAALYYATLSR